MFKKGDLVVCDFQPKVKHTMGADLLLLDFDLLGEMGIYLKHRNNHSGYVYFAKYQYIHPFSWSGLSKLEDAYYVCNK